MFSPSAITAEMMPMFRIASEVFHDPLNSALRVVPSSTNSSASSENRIGARQGLDLSA